MKRAITALALLLAWSIQAQTIYRCGNAYSDEPCAGAKEVDILPTDGAHSLSGTRRRNHESYMRDVNRAVDKAMETLTGLPAEEREKQRAERKAKSIPRIDVNELKR